MSLEFRPVCDADGLETMLYRCPVCKTKFRKQVAPSSYGHRIEEDCASCGSHLSNAYGGMHRGVLHHAISYSILEWRDRGDGGHKCGSRCRSAQGPTCECQCKGHNHGAGN